MFQTTSQIMIIPGEYGTTNSTGLAVTGNSPGCSPGLSQSPKPALQQWNIDANDLLKLLVMSKIANEHGP